MRFCLGKMAANEDFNPEREGWHRVREPGFATFYAVGIPVAAALCAGLSIAITSVGDRSASIVIKPGDVTPLRLLVGVFVVIGTVLFVIAAHEAVHLIAHPAAGLSKDSVIGIWPSRGVAYAHFDGPITQGWRRSGLWRRVTGYFSGRASVRGKDDPLGSGAEDDDRVVLRGQTGVGVGGVDVLRPVPLQGDEVGAAVILANEVGLAGRGRGGRQR